MDVVLSSSLSLDTPGPWNKVGSLASMFNISWNIFNIGQFPLIGVCTLE